MEEHFEQVCCIPYMKHIYSTLFIIKSELFYLNSVMQFFKKMFCIIHPAI